MIEYQYDEERQVALYFAKLLNDQLATTILEKGYVESSDEATHLSKFFWNMVNKSAAEVVRLPVEGSAEYWAEKLYNSFGAYLENAGFEQQWDAEIENA